MPSAWLLRGLRYFPLEISTEVTLGAGPTHLTTGENPEEEVRIPGSLEAPSLDALALDGLLSQEVEGYRGPELCSGGPLGILLSVSGVIRVESHDGRSVKSRSFSPLYGTWPPWRTIEDVELATLAWVDWYNHRRLHSACDNIPPAEFETRYYQQQEAVGAA